MDPAHKIPVEYQCPNCGEKWTVTIWSGMISFVDEYATLCDRCEEEQTTGQPEETL